MGKINSKFSKLPYLQKLKNITLANWKVFKILNKYEMCIICFKFILFKSKF